jgi:hypothetical protein
MQPSKDGQKISTHVQRNIENSLSREQTASLSTDKHEESFLLTVSVRMRKRKSRVIIFVKPFMHYHHPSSRFL